MPRPVAGLSSTSGSSSLTRALTSRCIGLIAQKQLESLRWTIGSLIAGLVAVRAIRQLLP